jgi:hypothetical protein
MMVHPKHKTHISCRIGSPANILLVFFCFVPETKVVTVQRPLTNSDLSRTSVMGPASTGVSESPMAEDSELH